MSKTKLILGDNIESLKKLPDNSIDSVVTDSPYGLSFMNRVWDYDVPSIELWKEVYRVLKPGGHLLSFGGTRTYHRMCVNLEDGGFEIRDCISWIYGCLDDKSEILTDSGWKRYTDISTTDKALSWNCDLDILEFNKIDEIIIKPYKGDMVKLENKHTDQILTPNHRVYNKYKRKDRNYTGDSWEVCEAGDMKKSGSYDLPLASFYDGVGIGGEDYAKLLGWIWSEGEYDKKGTAIRINQSSVNQPFVDEIKLLIEKLGIKYSHYTREREYNYKHKGIQSYIDNSFYFSTENEINNSIRRDMPNKKLSFDFVKSMSINEKLAFLETSHKGDGSKNRETIYQNDLGQLELLQFMLFTTGRSSYFDLNKMSINFRNKSTTQLQHSKLNKKIYYSGNVWCIRVKNNAFVVRRGDKVFITGNSGFPKSLNIGKAVDKIQGNEREVGESKGTYVSSGGQLLGENIRTERFETKGTSPYEGQGTALKPAQELICLARKPISEKTIAENVIKWGTGGINIDGCRIGTDVLTHKGAGKSNIGALSGSFKNGTKEGLKFTSEGRFPANLIFDEEAAELLDEQSGTLSSQSKSKRKGGFKTEYVGGENVNKYETLAYTDNGGASRFFYQAKVSKSERNLGLDGFEEKETSGQVECKKCIKCNKYYQAGDGRELCSCIEPDYKKPTTKNSHPTVKPINLMTYLCRLVTPKGGIVLDPFLGSGSTGIAALLEGFKFCGMEMDADYMKIAEARIENFEEYRKFIKK